MGICMKAYKGFDKDLKCRGFQYEVGKTYETDEAKLCASGFHACEAPLDVFAYYAPANGRFCEVELDKVTEETAEDSKRVGKKISIGAEIGIPCLVKAHIEWVKEHIDTSKKQTIIPGYASSASNTGYASSASNTGNRSSASNTGYASSASVLGKGSVALVVGKDSKAKACFGSAIVICERGEWDGEEYPLLAIKAAIIDGTTLKPDTWYTLRGGEFVEVEEE